MASKACRKPRLPVLFEMIREVNRLRESDVQAAAGLAAQLKQLASVLGVLQLEPEAFLQVGAAGKVDAAEIDALIAARLQARAEKNWAESDRIRDQLTPWAWCWKMVGAVPPGAWPSKPRAQRQRPLSRPFSFFGFLRCERAAETHKERSR
jgi:hypothetical protein